MEGSYCPAKQDTCNNIKTEVFSKANKRIFVVYDLPNRNKKLFAQVYSYSLHNNVSSKSCWVTCVCVCERERGLMCLFLPLPSQLAGFYPGRFETLPLALPMKGEKKTPLPKRCLFCAFSWLPLKRPFPPPAPKK